MNAMSSIRWKQASILELDPNDLQLAGGRLDTSSIKDTFRELFIGSPQSSGPSSPKPVVLKRRRRRPATAGSSRNIQKGTVRKDTAVMDLAAMLSAPAASTKKPRPVSAPLGKRTTVANLTNEIEEDTQQMVNEANNFCRTLGLAKKFSLQTWDRILRRSCLRILLTIDGQQIPSSMSTERFDREYVKLKRAATEQRKEQSKLSFAGGSSLKNMSSAQYAKNARTVLDDMLRDTVDLTKALAQQMEVLHVPGSQQGFSCFKPIDRRPQRLP